MTPGTGSSQMAVHWQGHIEATQSTGYAINISNGGLTFSGQWVGNNSQSGALCNVTAPYSGAGTGLLLTDVQFNDSGATFIPYGPYPTSGSYAWCDGAGPVRLGHISALGNTTLGLFAISNNKIPHALLPSIGEWQTWGGGTAILDTTVYPNGTTGSIRLASGGSVENITMNMPCAPGDMAAVQIQVKTSGVVSSGGVVGLRISYLDPSQGTLLANSWAMIPNDYAAFTPLRSMPTQIRAPPGTAYCSLYVIMTGGGYAWFGYPMMTVGH